MLTYSLTRRSTGLLPTCGWVCMTEWLLGRSKPRPSHPWDDRELVTGKFKKDEFVARVMDHMADQYDGPIGSDRLTWGCSRVGSKVHEFQPVARDFRRLSVGTAAHIEEPGILDEEMSDVD